jgi:exodeoxyribonuclease VII large subunit
MFKPRSQQLRFRPADGMQVLAYARISLYEPRGEFQLVVEHLEPAGEGLLRMKFEALKQKLAAEGLFETERKRALPLWPRAIGVVTSPSGAAVRDILHVLARRNPAVPVFIYPCAVQGAAAAGEIANAIATANRRAECDVLIVARGGGSLEDLWAFNEEPVVRAIAGSALPVISGVGHEIDFTLSDFAADVRAPTPSAAAELAVQDRLEALRIFARLEQRLGAGLRNRVQIAEHRLTALSARLVHPGRRIEQHHQRLDELLRRLTPALRRTLQFKQSRLRAAEAALASATPSRRVLLAQSRLQGVEQRLRGALPLVLTRLSARVAEAERTLLAVSPVATLARGYAIVTQANGEIARDAAQLAAGDVVQARLARGALDLRVERALPEATEPPASQ